jgi:signal transduction histidine kinase
MKRILLCLSWMLSGLLVADLAAQVAVTGMRIDGKDLGAIALPGQQAAGPNILRVPPGTRQVQFAVSCGAFQPGKPYRLRYRLEGQDLGWNDLPSPMRLVIRILDRANRIIAATESKLDHTSSGWRGTVQNSAFTRLHLEAAAPDRAAKVQIWCVSGGPESTTGVFAFRNARVQVGEPGSEHFREVTFSTETGTDLGEPLGSPADWRRDGSRPQMAQVLSLTNPQPHHVLALADFDTQTFAAWLTPPEKCVPVRPGDHIAVEWEECHCVGQGGGGTLTYERLRPGNYWLRVAAVGMDDTSIAPEASLNFIVLTPIWSRLSFWLLVGSVAAVGASLAARHLTRKRLQRQVDRLGRQHLLEQERTRIARDIHDDLGTSLTQICLLSESARKHAAGSPETLADLDRICASSRESVQAMDEIVWAADPRNDSLDELATYIGGFAQDLLNAVGVRCRLDIPMRLPDWNLSAELRHNAFLAFKEALNNSLKHGQPTEVRIALSVEDSRFVLSVEDNGCGFTPGRGSGHGLQNMRSRLDKIGGEFFVDSTAGRGTKIRFVIPVPANA